MVVISVLGTKGGVGKSTVTMNLAIWMSKLEPNEWILLIDGDMHVRSTELKMCSITDATLADVLDGKSDLEDAVYQSALQMNGRTLYPNLAILPAGGRFLPSIRGSPLEFLSNLKKKFDRIMVKLRNKFEWIFVDTPASMSFEHLIFTAIADSVIYVCEPNDDSIDSTRATARGLKEFMEVDALGVVLNRFPSILKEEVWKKKAETIAPLLGIVPDDPFVPLSFSENLPVAAAYPDCPASKSIKEIAMAVYRARIKKVDFKGRFDKAIDRTMEKT